MRLSYRNALCLLVLASLSAVVTPQTTTTTTILGDGTSRTETYDANGNLISWSSGPTAAAPTAVAATPVAHPVATPALMSVDGSTDAGLATTSITSTTDGGPMTIANHPTPQPPQVTQPQATPAPQAPQTQQPQPTPAPQPPQTTKPTTTTAAPKPTQTTTPKPTTAKPTAAVSTTPPTEAPTTPTDTELPSTSVPPTTAPPTTSAAPVSSIPPATSAAPAGTNAANTTAPAGNDKPASTTPSDAASQMTEGPKASESTSTSSSETAKPLSEESSDASSGRSGVAGRSGGSWGVVVTVAGVICAIVGISAFALVTRRRKMELNDAKASNDNLDFEDGTTPADARPGNNAPHAAVPPPAAMMSPQRVSYDFRRASDAPGPRGPALATPVDTMASMPSRQSRAASAPTRHSRGGSVPTRQSRTASFAPVPVHHTPAAGSVLETRESQESRMSSFYCESNDSFISSASVAPPPPPSDGFEAAAMGSSSDASSTDFTPTDSFVMATTAAKTGMNDSIVSSNMEYEFCDDSFQPVSNRGTVPNAYRGTATNLNRGTVASAGSIPSASFSILDKDATEITGKSSYDYGDDELSEDDDGELDMDEGIDFETASNNSFTQTFYEPRDDSYSDDYARGSAADSAIRGSTDSLFSRSSSEFSERKTDDSLA